MAINKTHLNGRIDAVRQEKKFQIDRKYPTVDVTSEIACLVADGKVKIRPAAYIERVAKSHLRQKYNRSIDPVELFHTRGLAARLRTRNKRNEALRNGILSRFNLIARSVLDEVLLYGVDVRQQIARLEKFKI